MNSEPELINDCFLHHHLFCEIWNISCLFLFPQEECNVCKTIEGVPQVVYFPATIRVQYLAWNLEGMEILERPFICIHYVYSSYSSKLLSNNCQKQVANVLLNSLEQSISIQNMFALLREVLVSKNNIRTQSI